MRTLYIDCISGISGDMFIGALLDAGADPAILVDGLKKLQLEDEYELAWRKVNKNGITATKFDVVLKHNDKQGHSHEHHHGHNHEQGHSHEHHYGHDHEQGHSHDEHHHGHDHEQGHSHEHHHGHDHEQGHSHEHHHGHDHEQGHSHDEHHHGHDHEQGHSHEHHHGHNHSHGHHHRSYRDIVAMIEGAGYEASVRDMALQLFKIIGEAEGKIHGVPLENVHFHEVGAVDSIIDIVGAAILIDSLNIEAIYASAVPVGSGKIRIDHGIYPVPAPATLEILKGVRIQQSQIRGELTTPTGAALAAVLGSQYGPLPSMTVTEIGYGAGTKSFPQHPNVVRVVIGEQ